MTGVSSLVHNVRAGDAQDGRARQCHDSEGQERLGSRPLGFSHDQHGQQPSSVRQRRSGRGSEYVKPGLEAWIDGPVRMASASRK